jgi:hypothetical protein
VSGSREPAVKSFSDLGFASVRDGQSHTIEFCLNGYATATGRIVLKPGETKDMAMTSSNGVPIGLMKNTIKMPRCVIPQVPSQGQSAFYVV